jgi:hypothetical protein
VYIGIFYLTLFDKKIQQNCFELQITCILVNCFPVFSNNDVAIFLTYQKINMQTNIASPGISSNGKNLFGISLTAALAGFIFGFDTVVISGADKPIQELWHTSPWFHGFFIMSMALWGTVVGALAGGIPTQKYGRKKC